MFFSLISIPVFPLSIRAWWTSSTTIVMCRAPSRLPLLRKLVAAADWMVASQLSGALVNFSLHSRWCKWAKSIAFHYIHCYSSLGDVHCFQGHCHPSVRCYLLILKLVKISHFSRFQDFDLKFCRNIHPRALFHSHILGNYWFWTSEFSWEVWKKIMFVSVFNCL